MVSNYFNPNQSFNSQDQYKDLSDEERIRLTAIQVIIYIAALAVGLLFCALIGSCTTQKIIEQHHHHTSEVDSMALQSLVDARMSSWHEQMDSSWRQIISQARSEWASHEDKKETITETVTSWVDSLGRQMRQEQRTTERTLSRDQQHREERLTQEFEARLQTALARHDSVWQEKMKLIQTHWQQSDSTSIKETPVPADNRPWYQRWWDNIRFILLGAAIAVILWITSSIWRKWLPFGGIT